MTLKVLLADDHETILEGMKSLLENVGGVKVIGEAHDGLQAIHLARRLHPDLIIMDIVMPHLSGVDATRIIVSEKPKTKVISFSMHTEHSCITNMLQAGAKGYLFKEYMFDNAAMLEELKQAIKAISKDRIYISKEIQYGACV